MTTRYQQFITRYTKENRLEVGKGHFTLGECNTCGTLVLTNLERDKPYNVELLDITKECPNCKEVYQRSPELVVWTLNVIAKAIENLKREGQK